ncbi:hypothetical protein GCM10010922_19860 [Microbacterium sorbitolivorans]|uniref:Uncharacterized protein n=1 Tax=Microbacterium sorbitolivorans TaxID=1867410 RepID=A0A367YAB1_9MICO|nr:hypothetical protein [Microbacterium sorbitolivorans]RCK61962.1 hypothetical protein DTO57_04965 [Microbacterium sorbitolivorans]GGF44296.1 hypothetical protein GCM10010922_19860 [Microbacterium sorbitolivorans]
MRVRSLSIPIVALTLLAAGCTSETAPDPAPTAEPTETPLSDPTTLAELQTYVQDTGIADTGIIAMTPGSATGVDVQLMWDELPSPDEQLAALSAVEGEAAGIVDDAELNAIALGSIAGASVFAGIITDENPGPEVLRAMVDTTADSPCATATLSHETYGDAPEARVTLDCRVEAADLIELAESYDAVTATRFDVDGVDNTVWEVSVDGWTTSDAFLRLDMGPIEGRQDLLVDLATMAEEHGVTRIQVTDGVTGFGLHGTADAAQSELCAAMRDRIMADGMAHAGVYLQLPEADGDDAWACYLTE